LYCIFTIANHLLNFVLRKQLQIMDNYSFFVVA
jgi:hypothetical protein